MPTPIEEVEARVLRRVRRQPTDLLSDLRNLVHEASKQICARKKYWFLELEQLYPITVGTGSWWELTLTAPFDSPVGAYELRDSKYHADLEYLTFQQALLLFEKPSATAIRGQIRAYSENDDFSKILIHPVPIVNTSVYLQWRARHLPKLTANGTFDILTDEFTELLVKWTEGLCWDFLGETSKSDRALSLADRIAATTIDLENVRKRLQGVKSLKVRTGALDIQTGGRLHTRRRFF